MESGQEAIADEEIIYRRVPAKPPWFKEGVGITSRAFEPNAKRDSTGVSVYRSKYKSLEEAAYGKPGSYYYVAVLRAGDLKRRGVNLVTRPLENDPGHAELSDLTSNNIGDSQTLEITRILIELCLRVEGPFFTPSNDQ